MCFLSGRELRVSIALSKREYTPAVECASPASTRDLRSSSRSPERTHGGTGVIEFGGGDDEDEQQANELDEEAAQTQPTLGLHRPPSILTALTSATATGPVQKREPDSGLQRRAARLKREPDTVKQEPSSANASARANAPATATAAAAVKREPIEITDADEEEVQLVKQEPMEVEEQDSWAEGVDEEEEHDEQNEGSTHASEGEDDHEGQSPERERKQRHRDRQPRPSADPNNERTLFVR